MTSGAENSSLDTFKLIGLSHVTAKLDIREKFTIPPDQIRDAYLEGSKKAGSIFIISTCNRTELYTNSGNLHELRELLIKYSNGTHEDLEKYSYLKQGEEAVKHLFRVSVGMDSQIFGDHEIIGQVRRSFKLAKELDALDTFTDRLFQQIFNTSKKIRSETAICDGPASTSYAAIHYLRNHFGNIHDKKILLFGAGKIGTITCENLINHVDIGNIRIINRSEERAHRLAGKYGIAVSPIEKLEEEITRHDVVIVATNSQKFTVDRNSIDPERTPGLFIDLSVPRNVNPEIRNFEKCTVAYIDDLTVLQQEAIEKRRSSIPVAEVLIEEGMEEFTRWSESRRLVPTIKAIKKSLKHLQKEELAPYTQKLAGNERKIVEETTTKIVNRIARNIIKHIKDKNNTKETPVELVEAILELELTENGKSSIRYPGE